MIFMKKHFNLMIKSIHIKNILLIIVLIGSIFVISCRRMIKVEFPGGVKIESPIIKVGIGENLQKTRISSTMGMKIYKGGELLTNLNKGNIFIKNLSRSISVSIGDTKHRIMSTIYIVPNRYSYLKYDNKEYRGIIEILLTDEGFNVINILNIEEYLKGVVPYELPPNRYSEIEALKAQAIAARTYTLYTIGKYREKGFDICSTIACQVYNGKKGETPLSNRAVEETSGLVIVYNNKLIPALYSASCGGFTENIDNVFAGEKSSVLTGKPCDYDNIRLNWIYTDNFKPYSVEENLAIVLKIAKESIIRKNTLLIDGKTANSILEGIYKITGKKGDFFQTSNISISSVILKLNETFSFYKKGVKYIKGFEIPQELMFKYGKKKSFIMVHLYKEGILKNYNKLDVPLNIKQFIRFTMKLLIKYYNVFEKSKYVSSESKTILLKNSFNKEERYYLGGAIFYRKVNNKLFPAHMLYLTGKEQLKMFAIKDRIKILIVDYPRFSLSPKNIYPLWHKVYKRSKLEKIIKSRLSLDSLKDIVPLKRGVSGRINRLEIQGKRKSFFLFGIQIKKTLNLKDNNFVIDRWFDGRNIKYFTFIGRGWGHGVGMCQVGAYGMALQGKDYRDILKYYYTGVNIIRYDNLMKNK